MARELAQQDVAQPPLARTVGVTDRDDDAGGAIGRELVDLLHEVEDESLLISVRVDDRNPRTDEGIEEAGLGLGRSQLRNRPPRRR